MQEVFEKIIEKLESEYEDIKEIYKRTKDMSFYFTFQGVNKAIEIVKKESEKRYHGHFGCNTNGEHERCDGCGLTNCKRRNKIWFGAVDDDTDTNVVSNGWIPVSERLPKVEDLHEKSLDNCTCYIIQRRCGIMDVAHYIKVYGEPYFEANSIKMKDVVAWHPLPEPYNPNKCKDTDCSYNDGNECPEADGCAGYERKQTNADRIRSMSDEDLAELIASGELCAICPVCKYYCTEDCYFENEGTSKNCSKGIMEWLQSEVEE